MDRFTAFFPSLHLQSLVSMERTLRPAGWTRAFQQVPIRTGNVEAVFCVLGWDRWRERGHRAWLVAEPFTLLFLKHTSITSSRCQQLSLTETELRGGCTGKQPLNAARVSSAITRLEWPCRRELCVALGAKMKGNGKLRLYYFKGDCTEVSPLLAGRVLVLPS